MFPTLSTFGETRAIPPGRVLASSGPSARAASRRLRRVGAALAILVATAMPHAHAQSASSTSAAANVETARVSGTVAASASMTASAATAPGIAKTDNLAIGVAPSKSDPSNEPTPFHPLTDF
jgi:microcystin-dependent protein